MSNNEREADFISIQEGISNNQVYLKLGSKIYEKAKGHQQPSLNKVGIGERLALPYLNYLQVIS